MTYTDGIPPGFHKHFAAWVRLEPRCRSNDFSRGLEARIADPLWMLARQWQVGEFQGEDAGSPLEVHVKYKTQSLDSVRLGGTDESFDLPHSPLETMVEQEHIELNWRTRVQIGQQFERFVRSELKNSDTTEVINAYREKYPAKVTDWSNVDQTTRRFLEFMADRAIDGGDLLRDQIPVLDEGIKEQRNTILQRLNDWCEKLNIRRDADKPPAWRSQQLTYRFELNRPKENKPMKTHLIAPNYRNGELDWFAFNVMKPQGYWTQHVPIKTHPTRITIGGLSSRWWAFEDSAIDFGRLDVAKPDLAKLMLIEFMLIYVDDWFSVPLPVHQSAFLFGAGLEYQGDLENGVINIGLLN